MHISRWMGKKIRNAKGVKKCVVKKTLRFDDYKKCLDDGENVYRQQMMFRNKKHDVFTMNVNKIAVK